MTVYIVIVTVMSMPLFKWLAVQESVCDIATIAIVSFTAFHYPHQHTVDTPVCLPPRRRSQPSSLKSWHYTVCDIADIGVERREKGRFNQGKMSDTPPSWPHLPSSPLLAPTKQATYRCGARKFKWVESSKWAFWKWKAYHMIKVAP